MGVHSERADAAGRRVGVRPNDGQGGRGAPERAECAPEEEGDGVARAGCADVAGQTAGVRLGMDAAEGECAVVALVGPALDAAGGDGAATGDPGHWDTCWGRSFERGWPDLPASSLVLLLLVLLGASDSFLGLDMKC